jgi:hypothetical protein
MIRITKDKNAPIRLQSEMKQNEEVGLVQM